MQLLLKLVTGEELSQRVEAHSFIIGRSRQCDVVISLEGMSRKHCQLELIDGEVFITDLNSTNGVIIDGVRIPPNVKTPYALYLTLAFGAVQSMQIQLEEPAKDQSNFKSMTNLETAQLNSVATQATKNKTVKDVNSHLARSGPKLASQDHTKARIKSLLTNLIPLAILGGAIWWYTLQPTAEEPIEDGAIGTPAEESFAN